MNQVEEFAHRLRGAQNRAELLRLEKEILEFVTSEDFRELPEGDKDRLEDCLVEIQAKKDRFTGCDPWKTILG
jgi:hypothetical protein